MVVREVGLAAAAQEVAQGVVMAVAVTAAVATVAVELKAVGTKCWSRPKCCCKNTPRQHSSRCRAAVLEQRTSRRPRSR